MFRQSNILVPTDFSTHANYALKYAVALAMQFKGTLHFAHVLDSAAIAGVRGNAMWLNSADSETLVESMREHAKSRMANLAETAHSAGVESAEHIALGNPIHEILRIVEETDTTLLVISTHGRSGFEHIVFGSVAEKVVRQSPVPVLVIKHPEHEFVKEFDLTIDIRRILFPTDFSPFSEKALPFAVSLAREFNATLVIFHATEVPVVLPEFMPESAVQIGPQLEVEAQQLVAKMCEDIKEVKTEGHVRIGVAHKEICRLVDEAKIDLVVAPTHGRTGLTHALFGSVAEKVVRLAKCPVLTIRPEWKGPAT